MRLVDSEGDTDCVGDRLRDCERLSDPDGVDDCDGDVDSVVLAVTVAEGVGVCDAVTVPTWEPEDVWLAVRVLLGDRVPVADAVGLRVVVCDAVVDRVCVIEELRLLEGVKLRVCVGVLLSVPEGDAVADSLDVSD